MLNTILDILLSNSSVSMTRSGAEDSIIVSVNKAGTAASARLSFEELYSIALNDIEGATDIITDLIAGLNAEADLKIKRDSGIRQKLIDRLDDVKKAQETKEEE